MLLIPHLQPNFKHKSAIPPQSLDEHDKNRNTGVARPAPMRPVGITQASKDDVTGQRAILFSI